MSYDKQNWIDNETLVDAEHLNHMEDGIEEIADSALTGITVNGTPATVTDHVAELEIEAGGGGIYYGSCSTTASTAAKAVSCDLTELYAGAAVYVYFSTNNTADTPTLNMNGLGAKNIRNFGANASSSNPFKWAASAWILFIYNGTYWFPVGYKQDFYGTCSTAAGTAAKSVTSVSEFTLAKGASITVRFTYANTNDSPTLTVSSTGAYDIEGHTNWAAGEYVNFIFTGSLFVAQGTMPEYEDETLIYE